jgi:hypothetical protein
MREVKPDKPDHLKLSLLQVAKKFEQRWDKDVNWGMEDRPRTQYPFCFFPHLPTCGEERHRVSGGLVMPGSEEG